MSEWVIGKRRATVLSIEPEKLTRRPYVYLQFRYADDMRLAMDVLEAFEVSSRGTSAGASSSLRVVGRWELVKVALEAWFDVEGWPDGETNI